MSLRLLSINILLLVTVGLVFSCKKQRLKNDTEILAVKVSPNPTSDNINVSLGDIDISNASWYLSDNMGNVIVKNQVGSVNFTIDLSVYSKGVYYLTVQTDRHKEVIQIIRQ